jgi:large subunit ribosomal protein L4
MELALTSLKGTKKETVSVSDALFAAGMNADLVWQVATSQMSNKRRVLAHTKTRAEVAGGGKKPWRQKGTGRARHGSIRSPIWIGGGVAHGPTKDVVFKKTITAKQGRLALAAVLSSRVREGALIVSDALSVASGKTKDGAALVSGLRAKVPAWKPQTRVLVVLSGASADDLATRRALANLAKIDVVRASDLNVLTVLSYPLMVVASDALSALEKTFSISRTS